MRLPKLRATRQYNDMQDTFLGYNHNERIRENEWHDMQNISPRLFPMFAPRQPRSTVKALTTAHGMISRDAIVYVDGDTIYINHIAVTGLTLTDSPKTLINMGAYIIIMPDKKFVNTANLTDIGNIEAEYNYEGEVSYTPARVDGSDISLIGVIVGTTPPAEPIDGGYWIDTGGIADVLKQYSALSDVWTDVPTVYTKIALPGIGAHFKVYDGVEISGCEFDGELETAIKQINALNGSKILYDVKDDYIIVVGMLSRVFNQVDATITVKRKMPGMDFIIESENRLWGCKYGLVGDKTVNEIYASSLGDFKNWSKYMGISTDSYAAGVGTDGKFTGAITYLGYPTFFKEMSMHRVYGSMPSSYQIETTACRGVQEGSSKSLAIVNESLFYKGRTEVLVYDGSLPVGVSDALGGVQYTDAIGGAIKDRYYISMKTGDSYALFFYDAQKRIWYKEDNTQVKAFAALDNDLYLLVGNDIKAEFGTLGTKDAAVAYSATSGIIGYNYANRKYISRLNVRAKLEVGSSLSIAFRYDSRGDFDVVGGVESSGFVKTEMIPLKPKRCDHFEMRITGTGDAQIFSIAKILEIGGDGA